MKIRHFLLAIQVGAIAAITGCSGSGLGQVSGVVRVDGKPVSQGTIMFIPAQGKAAVGAIGPDGRYTLTTYKPDDGALIGEHRVTILCTHVGSASYTPATLEEEIQMGTKKGGTRILVPGKVTWVVPERYSKQDTTDLIRTVTSGEQTIDFDIPPQ